MTNPLRPKYAPTVNFGTDLSNTAYPGPKGDVGTPGKDGATIISGTVDPTNAIGKNGDFYLNVYSKTMFGPKNGSWPAGFSIIGAKGSTGAVSTTPGPQGPAGKTIISGGVNPTIEGTDGDYYFNTSSKVMFGPKSGGAWPAGFSIVGAAGVKGDTGNPGSSATVTVGTVTTLAAGSSATVANSGNSTAAKFDFGLPVGATGPAGPGVPAGGTAGLFLKKNSATDYDAVWAAISGSLANFTESKSTAAPNATVPVVQLAASSTETNVDLALTPKGGGALFMGPVSDGTTTGGNKRGSYAVDLQVLKSVVTQVASGSYAIISGGTYNTASANYALVAGGSANSVLGTYSNVSGGSNNTVSATYSSVCGGWNNAISAGSGYSVISGGQYNTLTGGGNACPGGSYATDRGINGVLVHSFGRFAKNGDAQREVYILRTQTTNATATQMSTSGGGVNSLSILSMPDNSVAFVRGRVVARSSTGVVSTWTFDAALKRGSGVATTALMATVTPTVFAQDAGASAWALAITADTANGGLKVLVTGDTSTINWVCTLENLTTGS